MGVDVSDTLLQFLERRGQPLRMRRAGRSFGAVTVRMGMPGLRLPPVFPNVLTTLPRSLLDQNHKHGEAYSYR
jgi:hypothetical protein